MNLDWHDYISGQAEILTVQSNKSNESKVENSKLKVPVPEPVKINLDQFSELFSQGMGKIK